MKAGVGPSVGFASGGRLTEELMSFLKGCPEIPFLARCTTTRRPPECHPKNGHFGKSEGFGNGLGRRPSTHFGTVSKYCPGFI
jgi:hypothetical protein